jgi:hypothetical protein
VCYYLVAVELVERAQPGAHAAAGAESLRKATCVTTLPLDLRLAADILNPEGLWPTQRAAVALAAL